MSVGESWSDRTLGIVRSDLFVLWSRRSTKVIVVVGVIAFCAYGAFMVRSTRPASASELRIAHHLMVEEASSPASVALLSRCRAHPEEFTRVLGKQPDCNSALDLHLADFVPRKPVTVEEASVNAVGQAGSYGVFALSLVLGVLSAGGAWSTGFLINQLIVRPRRWSAWVSKCIASCFYVSVAATVGVVSAWGILGCVETVRGASPLGFLNTSWVNLQFSTWLLAMMVTVMSFGITMLLRSSTGGLIAIGLYWLTSSYVVGALGIPKAIYLSAGNVLNGVVKNGLSAYDRSVTCSPNSKCDLYTFVSRQDALFMTMFLAFLVSCLSLFSFCTRDID